MVKLVSFFVSFVLLVSYTGFLLFIAHATGMRSKFGARDGVGMEGRRRGPLRDWFISLDTRFLCFGFYDYSFSFFAGSEGTQAAAIEG